MCVCVGVCVSITEFLPLCIVKKERETKEERQTVLHCLLDWDPVGFSAPRVENKKGKKKKKHNGAERKIISI